MRNDAQIRVALLYDFPHWILGDYAFQLEKILNEQSSRLQIRTFQYPSSVWEWWRIWRRGDVLHFLSPQPFYRLRGMIPKATVVTINHISSELQWNNFLQFHGTASALCTTNRQWYEILDRARETKASKLFLHPLGLDCKLFRPVPLARALLNRTFGFDVETLVLGFLCKEGFGFPKSERA